MLVFSIVTLPLRILRLIDNEGRYKENANTMIKQKSIEMRNFFMFPLFTTILIVFL